MNLEPMQKAAVLIEALPYIQRFIWLVGVSPLLTHIKEADAQTAQIEESNKKTMLTTQPTISYR